MGTELKRFDLEVYEAYILASMENNQYFSPINSLIFITYQLYSKGIISNNTINLKLIDNLKDYEKEFLELYRNSNNELMFNFCKDKNKVVNTLIKQNFFEELNVIKNKNFQCYAVNYKKTTKYFDFQNEIYLSDVKKSLSEIILDVEVIEKVENIIRDKIILFRAYTNKKTKWQKI